MYSKFFAAVAACAMTLGSFGVTEYFVDAEHGKDVYDGLAAAYDGTHGPKKTVQAAVDLAQTGSTSGAMNIVTLAPGDYDEGETGVTSDGVVSSNRVVVSTAPIILRSAGGRTTRDTTRLIGRWDTSGASDAKYFMGPRAVRCVWVEAAAAGTRIEGLTFLYGAANWGGDGGDHKHATGGGGVAYNNYDKQNIYVIDCAFVGCIGTRGGGLYNGSAVRCLFTQCRASKFGLAMRQCCAYNCICADNLKCPGASEGSGAVSYARTIVNCTVVGNELGGISAPQDKDKVYNCVAVLNANSQIATTYAPKNCVTSQNVFGDGCGVATANEIFSPATGDYRLSSGATSLTTGNAGWLAKIPEEFRSTDYFGNPRTTDGVVYCGAVQAYAVPAGGKLTCSPPTTTDLDRSGCVALNGHVCVRELYEQGEAWPRTVKLSWSLTPGGARTTGLVRYMRGDSAVWPLTDDTAWVLAPQTGNVNVYQQTATVTYTDPVAGNDETGDGTSGNPWKTLQRAVENPGDRQLIIAREGDYDSCGSYANVWQGLTNRVLVASNKIMRVLAEKGPSRTFITGAADFEGAVAGNAYGLGPASVRCVAVMDKGSCAFQGFTLRSGHSSRGPESTDNDVPEAHGAAFLNGVSTTNYKTGFLVDCVVSDCVGSRGVAAYGGVCERTLFTGNTATRLGVFRYADLRSCLVTGNDTDTRGVFEDVSYAYNCTFAGNVVYCLGNCNTYNCISYGNPKGDVKYNSGEGRTHSCFLYDKLAYDSQVLEGADVVRDVAGFVGEAEGDYRLLNVSPAAGLGLVDSLKSAMDFTGRPFAFAADGHVNAGAFAGTEPGVRVVPNAIAGTTHSALYGFRTADSIEVPLPATGTYGRAVCGYVLGGETQSVSSATLTVSRAQAETVPYVIDPVFLCHFYVDDDTGDDGNDGGADTKAFKTLARASAVARLAGDVVTVLPGTYEEGTVNLTEAEGGWDSVVKIPCRVAVFPGVTFESRDGAAVTVVKGASATGTLDFDVDSKGCGTNAVRCAFVGNGAVLRGFTLQGGRTSYGQLEVEGKVDKQGVDYCGGGVQTPRAENAGLVSTWLTRLVENCVIDDCYAPRAGAGRFAFFRNCTITRCGGRNLGPTVRESVLANCLFRNNANNEIYNCSLYDCTVGGKYSYGGDYGTLPLVNTAFIDSKPTIAAEVISNCAYATGATVTQKAGGVNVNPLRVASFKLDDDGRPTKASPLVDAGDRRLLPEGCETDCGGGQRIYNGQLDIGCYEYDWRGDFAAALGSRKLAVDAAGSEVTTNADGKVSVPAGELAATWTSPAGGTGAPCTFTAEVTGTGTLTVTLNGETYRTLTSADGETTLSFVSPFESNALAFAYAPGANDTGSALLGGFRHLIGMTVIVR